MAFRNVMIESPARLSLKKEQLVICTDREYSLPVEDLSALLLENRQSSITTAVLSRLGQSGCALFVCDEKHLPCAVLTPYARHSRMLGISCCSIPSIAACATAWTRSASTGTA